MANWLRLKHGRTPRPLDGESAIFADEDGTIMVRDPEGTDTELGAGGNGGSQPILESDELILDHTDILALSEGTYFDIVAAPGAGKWLHFVSGLLVADATAVAYGNINAQAYMDVEWNGGAAASTRIEGSFDLPAVLGGDGEITAQPLGPALRIDGTSIAISYVDKSQVENLALSLFGWNNNAGPWSGGDAANILRVKVFYTVEDI